MVIDRSNAGTALPPLSDPAIQEPASTMPESRRGSPTIPRGGTQEGAPFILSLWVRLGLGLGPPCGTWKAS